MKIRAIDVKNLTRNDLNLSLKKSDKNTSTCLNSQPLNLNSIPHYYPINFTARSNVSKLRALFEYRLPCIYTGYPTISPKLLPKWIKSGLFNRPIKEVLPSIEQYSNDFEGMEKKFITLLTEHLKINPNKTMQEILMDVKPIYKRRLDKKQGYIFKELVELSHELPDKYRYKFNQFMAITDRMVNEKPVAIPFSAYEFWYKLDKIKDIVTTGQDLKSKKVINKIIKESKRLTPSTNANTIEHQKNVVNFINIILKKSVLKNNKQLRALIEESQARLDKKQTIIKFSRKSFLYDLNSILADLPDKEFLDRMVLVAQKLPTSQESFSAYVMKNVGESNDRLGHRIIWPYIASIEHLTPRSRGGKDILQNTAVATTRANSDRSNIDFPKQIKRKPKTPEFCQKNIDRHIELYHDGTYLKIGMSPTYITDIAKTYYEISNHKIKVDISKL